ncbi:MAG: EamA/RhaT family transporter, partial [Paracoccaceae bacterium]
VSFIGVGLFGEVIGLNVAIGAAIVIAAGLFTFWRERLRHRTL